MFWIKTFLEAKTERCNCVRLRMENRNGRPDVLPGAQQGRMSAPGPDGIPKRAWSSLAGARTLHGLAKEIYNGRFVSSNLNDALMVFPPKNNEESDSTDPTRTADCCRPISLKNDDIKIISGVQNKLISDIAARCLSPLQRGFVKGRNFLYSILELDSSAHFASVWANDGDLPIMLLLDIKAAFPSLAHSWLFMVLARLGIPRGFMMLLRELYSRNSTYMRTSDGLSWLLIYGQE